MKDAILILGGGFIGQALAKRLVESGKSVTIVCRNKPEHPEENISWQQGNLDDPDSLGELSTYQAIVHAASTSMPGHHIQNPSIEAEENLLPLLRLLEILRAYPDIPLLFFSSGGAIYGNPITTPVPETHPLSPLSNHAACKAAAEHFLRIFANQGHTVTILRASNIYGPMQPLRTGFGIIRTLLEHAKLGTPATIWGDGKTVRDYLYIGDLIDACMAVLKNPSSDTFNIGSGTGYSINELCSFIEQITGKALDLTYQPARSVDVQRIVLDNTAISERYSWSPLITIEQGIRSTWEWMQNHP